MKKTKLISLAVLSITTLAIMAGCQNKTGNDTTTKTSTTLSSATKESTATDATDGSTQSLSSLAISLDDAIAVYQEAYPDSDITSIDLDSSFNNWYYTVEGVNDTTEFELRIDATTKEVDNKKEEALDKEDSAGVKRQNDKLDLANLASLEDITAAAQEAATSGEATDWELDKELDTTYWKVTIKDGTKEVEVKINAQTKAILETELDD